MLALREVFVAVEMGMHKLYMDKRMCEGLIHIHVCAECVNVITFVHTWVNVHIYWQRRKIRIVLVHALVRPCVVYAYPFYHKYVPTRTSESFIKSLWPS